MLGPTGSVHLFTRATSTKPDSIVLLHTNPAAALLMAELRLCLALMTVSDRPSPARHVASDLLEMAAAHLTVPHQIQTGVLGRYQRPVVDAVSKQRGLGVTKSMAVQDNRSTPAVALQQKATKRHKKR